MYYTEAIVRSICKSSEMSVKLSPHADWTDPQDKERLFLIQLVEGTPELKKFEAMSVSDSQMFGVRRDMENMMLFAYGKRVKVRFFMTLLEGDKFSIERVQLC